jgi:prophage regulatory protein
MMVPPLPKGIFMKNLIKLPQVEAALAVGRSTVYQWAKDGLLPTPIKMGAKSSAWLSDEVSAIQQARIECRTEQEIKALVVNLVAARKNGGA